MISRFVTLSRLARRPSARLAAVLTQVSSRRSPLSPASWRLALYAACRSAADRALFYTPVITL